jgi:hypothetical protein
MLVKNINGTSDSPKCPCGTWLKHWERYSKKTAGLCAELTCQKPAEVGAHVQKAGEERNWYIIPLCKEHNNQQGELLFLSDDAVLIPATDRSKCSS